MEERVVLKDISGSQTFGVAEVAKLNQAQRLQIALKRFGLFALLAAATLPLPVIHLVLPPLFIVIGLVMSSLSFLEKERINYVTGECPSCRKEVRFGQRRTAEVMKDVCDQCRNMIQIERQ